MSLRIRWESNVDQLQNFAIARCFLSGRGIENGRQAGRLRAFQTCHDGVERRFQTGDEDAGFREELVVDPCHVFGDKDAFAPEATLI